MIKIDQSQGTDKIIFLKYSRARNVKRYLKNVHLGAEGRDK